MTLLIEPEEVEPPLRMFYQTKHNFYKHFYKNASVKEINDWHWQLKNRIKTVENLTRFIKLSAAEIEAFKPTQKQILPFSITPHYMRLIDPNNPEQAIRKASIPKINEHIHSQYEKEDPLHKDKNSPVPCLVHRYPD